MSHPNAFLTPRGRLQLAQCVVDQCWSLRRAAERFPVSVPTAERWAKRYLKEGPEPHHARGMGLYPPLPLRSRAGCCFPRLAPCLQSPSSRHCAQRSDASQPRHQPLRSIQLVAAGAFCGLPMVAQQERLAWCLPQEYQYSYLPQRVLGRKLLPPVTGANGMRQSRTAASGW